MTTTLIETTATTTAPLAKAGFLVAALASVATVSVAAVAKAADVSLDVSGEPIPLGGFATLTFAFSLVGLAIAAVP